MAARTVPIYSKEIGATVKSVSGDKGQRLAAEYSLAADDLYVLARVESDEPALYYTTGHASEDEHGMDAAVSVQEVTPDTIYLGYPNWWSDIMRQTAP